MEDNKFNYMLLGRLQQDIEYFLGYGNRCEKHLYYGEINIHFKKMVNLWKILPEKPDWFRAVDFINYKKLLAEPQTA